MKRILFSFLGLFLVMNLTYAGGLVTNTNQSVTWARMLVRDASTSIDAVYYNPAGLTKLSDGLHVSVSNQSIFQKRTLSNSMIPNTEYEGKVTAPFFPNFYAAYKTGKIVFSAGFVPIGGGGSAKFDKGVPMIDLMVGAMAADPTIAAAIAPLTPAGAYKTSASFEGSSVYFGIQAGISYEITEMISAYAGARYVMAKNTTLGSIEGITIVSAEGPEVPLPDPFGSANIDAEQIGTGFTPILGLNLAMMDDALNIGVKYEFQTNMEVENNTTVDDVGLYPDGEKVNADMPAQLSIGVNYKLTDDFSAQIGYHTYFDKNTGWEGVDDIIDKNYMEIGLGLEYNISDQLLISAGYLRGQTGVNDNYHWDMSYSLNSNTFGFGGAYKVNDMLTLQLGGYYTAYTEATITTTIAPGFSYDQTYKKSNMSIAIGLDFTFGGE